MKRLAWLLPIVCTPCLLGQFSQTVQFTKLALTTSQQPYTTLLPNIGQGAHILAMLGHDAPGHTCAASDYQLTTAQLKYSIDGIVYLPLLIMTANPNSTGLFRDVRYATGAFPFLQASIGIGSLNCSVDIFYSGSLYPVGQIPPEFSSFFTAGASVIGGNAAVPKASLTFTPNITGLLLNTDGSGAIHRLSVYGMSLQNGSGSAETVTVYAGVVPNCGTGPGSVNNTNAFFTTTIPANSNVILANTERVPQYSSTCGNTKSNCQGFCADLGTNASGHNFQAQIVYRIEP